MKKIIIVLILLFAFSLPCLAEGEGDSFDGLYDAIDTESLESALDDDTADYLRKYGISPKSYEWVNKLNPESVFSHIGEFLKSGIKRPLKSGASLIAIILITAAITSLGAESGRFAPALYAAVLAGAAIIIGDIWGCVSASCSAIKGCSSFMLSFIPVFAATVALSGKAVTAASMSALLLSAAEGISAFASFLILPLTGGYLSLSISESVSPLIKGAGASNAIKKISNFSMGLITVIFTGILGIQTAVNSAADTLSVKTAKFIVGTSVPVAGTALSEAASTIYSSMGLIKSTVGMYGVLALFVILAPLLCELIIWRGVLNVCIGIGSMLEIPKFSGLLRAVDTMLSVLLGIALLIAGMFVIGLSIVVSAGG